MSFERICEAIKFDGLSINSVAVVTGIPQSSLQRFCTGQQGLQMDGLLRVCETLDLELVRRFNAEELEEYFNEGWREAKAEIEAEEYQLPKSEAWSEESIELWNAYVAENEIDVDDADEFAEWQQEEYPEWSTQYDEMNYSEWESTAYDEWKAEERDRLESCEWIVITE